MGSTPPPQTRSRSKAQTVHSQAPTLETEKTANTSDSTSETSEESKPPDHEDGPIDEQADRAKKAAKENQFLSKPTTAPRREQSPTPERNRPESSKDKDPVHPLYTEGLESTIEQQEKERREKERENTNPKPPTRAPRPGIQKKQQAQARPTRDPSARKRDNRHRDPSARKRDPSAHKKRKRTPSPQRDRGRQRDPSAHKDPKRRRKAPSPSRRRTRDSKHQKEVRLKPRRSKTQSRKRRTSKKRKTNSADRRSSSGSTDRAEKVEKLAREIRKGVAGKERFADFTRAAFTMTAEIFVAVGYTSWEKVKTTQQTARDFMLADLRRPEKRRPLEDLTLLLDIFDVYECQRKNTNPKDPKYEAVTIQEAMKRWRPNMRDLTGHIKPSQDLCNHFSLEIAKGKLLSPPVFPYVVPDLSKKPWAIQEPAHTAALESWQKLQKSHKRPGTQEVSINQWFIYNLRYILAGDLAGAWDPFGGLAAQLNHIGIVLDLAVTEHAGVALSYDLQVKNLAKQMAETDREKNKVETLLSDLNQTIKNNVLREFGIMPTYTSHKSKPPKGDKDKGKGDKHKGKGRKSDKRGGGRFKDPGGGKGIQNDQPKQQHRPWHNDWYNNDWTQNNKPEEQPEAPPEQDSSQKTAMKKISKK